MAKLHIVCPNCSTKYPVADEKLAGRRVTCKKCSEKFTAQIEGAEEPAMVPFASDGAANTPLGDDLFGDFPASSSSVATAPALGAIPNKKRSTSSGSFPVMPVVIGGIGVVVVVILGIIAFSFASGGSGQPYKMDVAQQEFSNEESYKKHREVIYKQFDNMIEFFAAVEAIQGKEDLPKFIKKVEDLTWDMEVLPLQLSDVTPLPKNLQEQLNEESKQKLDGVEARAKAAGQILANYQGNLSVSFAVKRYHEEHGNFGMALNEISHRSPEKQEEVNRKQAIKYSFAKNPEQVPGLLYQFALDDYAKVKQITSSPILPDQLKRTLQRIQTLHKNIGGYSKEIANLPVFLGNTLTPTSQKYAAEVERIHASNHTALEALLANGVPFEAQTVSESVLRLSDEMRENWDSFNRSRPRADAEGKIGPMYYCFTPEEVDAFVAKHASYKQRIGDQPYVVMFIDARYAPEIETWRAGNFSDQCDEMNTQLMKVIWKPVQENEAFLSRLTSGIYQHALDVAGEKVAVVSFDEKVLTERARSGRSRGPGGFDPFGSRPDIYRPETPSTREPQSVTQAQPASQPQPEPEVGPSYQPPPDFDPRDLLIDPDFGPPGMGGEQRDLIQEMLSKLKETFGAEKMVRLECKSISSNQNKRILEIVQPWMFLDAHVSWHDPSINERVITILYAGDVNELAERITFGEIDEVLVDERRIRLKSINLPEQ